MSQPMFSSFSNLCVIAEYSESSLRSGLFFLICFILMSSVLSHTTGSPQMTVTSVPPSNSCCLSEQKAKAKSEMTKEADVSEKWRQASSKFLS